jgi:hypothetical protein
MTQHFFEAAVRVLRIEESGGKESIRMIRKPVPDEDLLADHLGPML